MAPKTQIGFELFDSDKWSRKLAESLHRIGHQLILVTPESRLIAEFDVDILPLGRGDGYVLRLVQDWEQLWTTGILFRRLNMCELERIDFDRDARHLESCYDHWIDLIESAVRRHASIHQDGTTD